MWDERPFASQDFCSLRDAGPATDTQLAFLVAGSDGGRPWTHVEQIVLDAPSLLLAPERLRAAWQELAERHEALRMVLRADEAGNVRLLVSGRPLVDLRQLDWSHLSRADELDQEQKALLAADRDEGADPSNGPGWRGLASILERGAVGLSGRSTMR